jgi:hypothetical protein
MPMIQHISLSKRSGMAVVVALAALAASVAPLAAQQQNRPRPQQQQQQQQAAPEEDDLEQIELTQKQIDAFIAGQAAIKAITARLKDDADPDEKMAAQMEAAVKKVGFADMDEFENVGDNIDFVFTGIDPKTKKFSDAEAMIQKDIARLNADKNMSPQQKKRMLEDLQRALESAPKLEYPGNAQLVAKNYDRLKRTME